MYMIFIIIATRIILIANLCVKVDQAYMDSCTESSDTQKQKFCNFVKLIISNKKDIERQGWFSDWQAMNTYEEEVQKRSFFI